jgi:hypothetical protein
MDNKTKNFLIELKALLEKYNAEITATSDSEFTPDIYLMVDRKIIYEEWCIIDAKNIRVNEKD